MSYSTVRKINRVCRTAASRCGGRALSCPTLAGVIPPHYLLGNLATLPGNLSQLQTWLGTNWVGKIYVASTIIWNGARFLQSGCSPNYMAGWWSLACCKHDMRSGMAFNAALANKSQVPVFIFTLASINKRIASGGNQALVSVAKITEDFPSMKDYAQRVIGCPALRDSRLSGIRLPKTSFLRWRFGDCHANLAGRVGAPDGSHVHANSWHKDLGASTILLSDEFLVWPRPLIVSKRTLGHDKHGHNINPSSLTNLLADV
jgi:hypothetical protein